MVWAIEVRVNLPLPSSAPAPMSPVQSGLILVLLNAGMNLGPTGYPGCRP